MAVTTPRRSIVRRACSVTAVAFVATVLGAGSPIAASASTTGTTVTGGTSLDTPANWAIVHEAAATGYVVPAKYAASCGALQ